MNSQGQCRLQRHDFQFAFPGRFAGVPLTGASSLSRKVFYSPTLILGLPHSQSCYLPFRNSRLSPAFAVPVSFRITIRFLSSTLLRPWSSETGFSIITLQLPPGENRESRLFALVKFPIRDYLVTLARLLRPSTFRSLFSSLAKFASQSFSPGD